jgi:hypothetical protein
MAVTTHASGTQSCTTLTEHTLTANPETTAGVFQVFLDLNDLADGEDLVVRIKEKVVSGGTQREVWQDYQANAQGAEKIWVSPSLMLINGWDVSIRATGTPSIPWSIRKAG